VDPQRERDEFERIELTARLQRARDFIAQYEEGLAFYRRQVEDTRYELGRLDERLGGERP
jgi:ribosomal protein L15E